MTAVFNRCDVGRMVAAAAAIQRQCERVRRRRRYVAVRKSAEYVVVVSFAVSAAIALRLSSPVFAFVVLLLSSLPPRIRRLSPFISSSFVAYRIASSSACVLFVVAVVNLFVVAVTFRHVLLLLCRHVLYYCRVAFHSLPYFNLLFCLSVMDSFSFFLVGLSVCQQRDSFRDIHLLQQRRALVKIILVK
jgi:hypothetical protein